MLDPSILYAQKYYDCIEHMKKRDNTKLHAFNLNFLNKSKNFIKTNIIQYINGM